jgi:hypothetical protein
MPQVIRIGEIYLADLFGVRLRVRVICSSSDHPDYWLCEAIDTPQQMLIHSASLSELNNNQEAY